MATRFVMPSCFKKSLSGLLGLMSCLGGGSSGAAATDSAAGGGGGGDGSGGGRSDATGSGVKSTDSREAVVPSELGVIIRVIPEPTRLVNYGCSYRHEAVAANVAKFFYQWATAGFRFGEKRATVTRSQSQKVNRSRCSPWFSTPPEPRPQRLSDSRQPLTWSCQRKHAGNE